MNNNNIIFLLSIFFVFLLSCGEESKATFQNSKSSDAVESGLSGTSDAPGPSFTDFSIIESPVDSTLDQLASIKEQSEKVDIDDQEAAEEKQKTKDAKREEERKKRRAERRAERKAKEAAARKDKPTIQFEKMVHRYGTIEQGEKVKHNFVFKNTGRKELVITNAKATCGCTQPSFPFIPIAPGEEGYIGVVFDSKGRLGHQRPKVTITTNADPPTYEIFLEGTVDAPQKEGK